MSIEHPSNEREQTEDARQGAFEDACREQFIADWLDQAMLAPEQKRVALEHIRTTAGAWRQYDGADFRVVESVVADDVWIVSFGIFCDEHETQRIDVAIPLA